MSSPNLLAEQLRQREAGENFPVASRLLPAGLRADLRAVYDVARSIDEIGDDAAIDPTVRLTRLDAFDTDLDRLWDGARPDLPVVVALAPTLARRPLPVEPFHALVAANRQDQITHSYDTFDELRGYCALSAEPVGRIVLSLFGVSTPERVSWSDDVCTALQLLEHLQDLGEDYRNGRVYLPGETLRACAATTDDLARSTASPQLRSAIEVEVRRARGLLDAGRPLVRSLRGLARIAVAGYVAGGLATAAALQRSGYDSLPGAPKPHRFDIARYALGLQFGGRS